MGTFYFVVCMAIILGIGIVGSIAEGIWTGLGVAVLTGIGLALLTALFATLGG